MSIEEKTISGLQADFDRTIRPEYVETYSFEYTYRLFLVLCFTKRNQVNALPTSRIDSLEPMFHQGLVNCVGALNANKGLSMNEEAKDQYASFATTMLMRYLKGGLEANPVALAKQVSKAMEKRLYTDKILEPDIHVTRVFLERK